MLSESTSSAYHDMVFDNARGLIYASLEGDVYVLSADSLAVQTTIAVGSLSFGMDIDPGGQYLAVTAANAEGPGEYIAIIDLNTQTIIKEIIPAGSTDVSQPMDVVFGRAGRMYSSGVPIPGGTDYLHVYDTSTWDELGQSIEPLDNHALLYTTEDGASLYVAYMKPGFYSIKRFDLSTDQPILSAATPDNHYLVNLCLMSDGRIITSSGEVWPADLSELLHDVEISSTFVACAPDLDQVFFVIGKTVIAYMATTYTQLWDRSVTQDLQKLFINPQETTLYATSSPELFRMPTVWPRIFLPFIQRLLPGIHGYINYQGNNNSGSSFPVELRFFDGERWSTIATTSSGPFGYHFSNVPSLGPGQAYYVLYRNSGYDSIYLWVYATPLLTQYSFGQGYQFKAFDVANIGLASPNHYSSAPLPVSFYWYTRTSTPEDIYEFNLYGPNGDPYFYSPPLGNGGIYTLTGLPPGFALWQYYGWEVWVYGDDGGYGVSFETYVITFTDTQLQSYSGLYTAAPAVSHPLDPYAGEDRWAWGDR